jgi:hypothetical protein
MKHKVIDNFLDEKYFDNLLTLFTDKKIEGNSHLPWYFRREINANHNVAKDNLFYMVHIFYENNMPLSSDFEKLFPLLEKLKIVCLMRIRANLYPNTEILHEHAMHVDYNFPHSAAILSLNTCDGYTKLEDGTKIDSVANRILLFDASNEHCSTTTTDVPARMNININYIKEQF